MATKNLKFAILDCKDNKEKCDEHGVEQNLALRFFGNIEKWKAVAVYLDTTMEEVLQEDVLLEKLEEIGSFLIIFTVILLFISNNLILFTKIFPFSFILRFHIANTAKKH